MKKINVVLIFLFSSISLHAVAQIEKPVKWSHVVTKKSNNGAFVLIRAVINPHWHIYSQYMPEGGLVKTSFSFAASKDYQIVEKTIEPKAVTVYEPSFKMNVSYFENKVTFQKKIKLIRDKTTIKVKCGLMACNDKKCLPPVRWSLVFL